jgi:hypothetical protein
MALAALGVLEATEELLHQASSDPQYISTSLFVEFKDGDRMVVWRGACNPVGQKVSNWRKTIHQDAKALAAGWQLLLADAHHPDHQALLPILKYSTTRPLLSFNYKEKTTRDWHERQQDVLAEGFPRYDTEYPAQPGRSLLVKLS